MNSRYYNSGELNITQDDFAAVFAQIKRELDLNEEDARYDDDIKQSIKENAIKLAKEQLFPNQHLKTRFAVSGTGIITADPNAFSIDLTAISDIHSIQVITKAEGSKHAEKICVTKVRSNCACGTGASELGKPSYEINGNLIVFNNLPANAAFIEVISDGGNIDYWFKRGSKLLVLLVESDIYSNVFKSYDLSNSIYQQYVLHYQDLEKQTYSLYDGQIRTSRGYW